MLPYNFNAGPESLRYLSIAEKFLGNRDFAGSKTYATRARESDPRLEQSDQIIAIADTLIAAEKQIGNQHLDWYAILQLARRTTDSELIASQYRRLAVLLNPNRNNFPYAEHAYKLVCEAWLVLSNSSRKFEFDSQISGGSNNHTQFNFIQSHFETPQSEQQHNGTTQFNFMQEHSEQLHQSSSEMQEQQQFMHPYGQQELFPNQAVEYLNQQQPLSQQQHNQHWLNQSEQHLSRPQAQQSQPQQQQQQQQQQQSLHWSQVQPQQPLPWQHQQQQQQPLPWQQQQQPLPWQQTEAQAPLARTQAQQFLPHHSPPPQPQQFLHQQQPSLSKHDPLPWQQSQSHQHSALHQPPPEQPLRQPTPPPQKPLRQPTPPPSKPPQPLRQATPPPQKPLRQPTPPPQMSLHQPPPSKPQQPLRQPTPPPQKPLRQPTPQPQMFVHQPTPQKPLLQPTPSSSKSLLHPTPPPSKPLHQPTPPPSKPLRQPTPPPPKPTSPPPKPLRQPTPPQQPQPQLHLPKQQPQPQAQQPLPWHQPKPQQVLPQSPPLHQQQQPLPPTQSSLPKPQPLLQSREQSPIPKPQPPLPGPQKLQNTPQYQTQTQSKAQLQPQLPLAPKPSLKSREQSPLPKPQVPLPAPQPDLPGPQILQRSPQYQPQPQLEPQPTPQPQPIPQPQPPSQPQPIPQPPSQPQPIPQPQSQPQPQLQSQSEPTNPPIHPQEQGEIGRSQEQHGITGDYSGDADSNPPNDVSSFWTACPYCYNMYEYPVAYAGCTLRCQNCRRAFHAAKVCTPPLEVEDKEAYFCCWGFFPLGISQSYMEKNKAGASTWTPISPMFALPQGVNGWNVGKQKNGVTNGGPDVSKRNDEWTNAGPDVNKRNTEWTNAGPDVNKRKNKRANAGPRTYIDDDQDSILDISSNEDSDEDWHNTKKKNAKSPKKKVSASKRVKRSGEEVPKKVRKSNIGNVQSGHAAEVERSVGAPNISVPSIPIDETSNGATSVITRKQPGRTAKDLGKLDLNVECSNEVEEPAQGTSGGSKAGAGVEDNIEGIGFFEGLDEFLNSLPILSVDGDDKVKDG